MIAIIRKIIFFAFLPLRNFFISFKLMSINPQNAQNIFSAMKIFFEKENLRPENGFMWRMNANFERIYPKDYNYGHRSDSFFDCHEFQTMKNINFMNESIKREKMLLP
jgi:hypothetical protein